MAFVKKTWKDRIVQYANRRLLTKSGGEVEQVIVTRDEGTVTEAGDKFDAATMNDLEDRLEYAFDNVSTAIECTQAEYDTWKNAGQLKPQTSYIITDAPNLNATASDIEYSSGVTVKQAIDSKQGKVNNSYLIDGLSTPSGITRQNGGYTQIGNLVIVNVRLNCTNSVATETDILLGLPAPVGSANIVAVTLNKDTYAVLTTSGNIRIVGNTLTSGVVLASACYLTATT